MIDELLNRNTVNINLDSDGLLSYLFLKMGGFNGSIGGYNHSNNEILSIYPTLEEMWNDAFIDIFVPNEKTFTIDQHILCGLFTDTKFGKNKINPHLLIEEHFANDTSYFKKYPFSTCLFIMAILERENKNIPILDFSIPTKLDTISLGDLILRADGVLLNYNKYNDNVKYWGDKMINYSNNGANTQNIINYLFGHTKMEAKEKNENISNFYKKYGLTKDGGYNNNDTLTNNIHLLNGLIKAFSKYMDIKVEKKEIQFYHYRGNDVFLESNRFDVNLNSFDTYSFVGKDKLSYTINYHKLDDVIHTEIFA